MKVIISCASIIMMMACTGVPTKVEKECNCLICEACDSLALCWEVEPQYMDIQKEIKWSDSLAFLVYEHLYNSGVYYLDSPTRDLINNEKFMYIMDKGWDGLCEIEDSTGCISYFYGAYNYHK